MSILPMSVLFVALHPPPVLRTALAAVMAGVPGARWQDGEQLHLTLRYIDDVEPRRVDDVADALARVDAPPVTLAACGVGVFDKGGRANALWVGVAPAAPLAALHRKLDRALVQLGLPPEERAYLPHVTVARLARGAGAAPKIAAWQARHAGIASAPATVSHFALFESVRGPAGSEYQMVGRWPLDGGN